MNRARPLFIVDAFNVKIFMNKRDDLERISSCNWKSEWEIFIRLHIEMKVNVVKDTSIISDELQHLETDLHDEGSHASDQAKNDEIETLVKLDECKM